jgi:vitamin B12 transporter
MTYRNILLAAASVAALHSTTALAQADDRPLDQLVVPGTRAPAGVSTDGLGGSITVIDAQAVEDRQTRVVSDLLRDVPGIAVSRSGPVGGQTQIRLRGTEANQTLVLIDGIEASDPSQGEFDFATLIADDVARVEVLRGQQSALYGSDAIGGVIHYITLDGHDAPGVRLRVEGGSFNTAEASARVAGVAGAWDYALSAADFATDGTPGVRDGVRDLDAKSHTLAGKLTFAPLANFRVRMVGRYSATFADTNPTSFTTGLPEDGEAYFANRARYLLVRPEWELLDGRWTNALTAQRNDTERRNYDAPGLVSSKTDGLREKLSYETAFKFGGDALKQQVTLAGDLKRETFQNVPISGFTAQNQPHEIVNKGVVAQYDLELMERLNLGGAIRYDRNTHFQNATTYRLQAAYRLGGGLRLRGAAGSGIKNPTMIELFGFDPSTFVGNPNLKAEKSKGWEAGADYTLLADQLKFGVTYFDSKLDDEIFTSFDASFNSTSLNRTTRSTQRGVELTAEARLGEQWRLDGAYTHLRARENGVMEVRRPDDIASANLSWRDATDRGGVTLTVRYNGQMNDVFFGPPSFDQTTKTLKAYTLVNLGGDIRLSQQISLFGRIENALDQRYEEVYGYPGTGRAGYLGLKAAF